MKMIFDFVLGEKIKELRFSNNLGLREFALIAEIEHH
jgi:hypothetical protein